MRDKYIIDYEKGDSIKDYFIVVTDGNIINGTRGSITIKDKTSDFPSFWIVSISPGEKLSSPEVLLNTVKYKTIIIIIIIKTIKIKIKIFFLEVHFPLVLFISSKSLKSFINLSSFSVSLIYFNI